MTKVWKKVPRVTRTCACGCGVSVTGTARRMYAKPYCKFKSYLRRKQREGWAPDSRFDPTKPKENPLNAVKLEGNLFEDVSSTVEGRQNWWPPGSLW